MLLPVLLFFCCVTASAQQSPFLIDSLKKELAKAKAPRDRIYVLGALSMNLMNTNIEEADKYGAQLKEEAELSRDRKLMVQALMFQGIRYAFMPANKAFMLKAEDYLTQAYELARKNELQKESAEALLFLCNIQVSLPEPDKALRFATQASSIVSTLDDDSLKVASFYAYGNVYQAKRERLLALRNYLNALRVAEKMPRKTPAEQTRRSSLLRNCYISLREFYSDIREYDKAIDYAQKAMDEQKFAGQGGRYQECIDYFYIGQLYTFKKDFSMSTYYFEKSIRLADTLKYEPLKMPGYNGLLRQFISQGEPKKALAYLNSRPDLKKFLSHFGVGHFIDAAYGTIHTELKNFDSARYYFEKAAPVYEAGGTLPVKMNFYAQLADYYKQSGKPAMAIDYYKKAMEMATQASNLESQRGIAKQLDSLYLQQGDYQQSYHYASLYHKFKDSLQKLGGEKDMLQMELTDEQERQKRREAEEAEALRQRHNLQYMGITVAIAVVFLLLVLLGIFQVSVTTIKVMGFFAFIFLFEFIILIADAKIHHYTHGEPLPILGIKIVLIAILLPLHHWIEHKVVTYLTSRRLILPQGKLPLRQLFSRKKVKQDENLFG
jgi:tetratricopeptide (TPR) repeat protein